MTFSPYPGLQAPFEISQTRVCNPGAKGGQAKDGPWWIPVASISRDSSTPAWQTLHECMLKMPLHTLKVLACTGCKLLDHVQAGPSRLRKTCIG